MRPRLTAFMTRSMRIGALVVLVSFTSGWALASTAFATRINTGLVNAFASVGQNLFGEAVFDSTFVPPNPVFPDGSVQMYVADDVKLGTGLNVFVPPNPTVPTEPCRVAMQIRVVPPNPTVPPNPIKIVVDPDVAPNGFDTQIEFASLAAYRPSLDRCAAGPVDGPLE